MTVWRTSVPCCCAVASEIETVKVWLSDDLDLLDPVGWNIF